MKSFYENSWLLLVLTFFHKKLHHRYLTGSYIHQGLRKWSNSSKCTRKIFSHKSLKPLSLEMHAHVIKRFFRCAYYLIYMSIWTLNKEMLGFDVLFQNYGGTEKNVGFGSQYFENSHFMTYMHCDPLGVFFTVCLFKFPINPSKNACCGSLFE